MAGKTVLLLALATLLLFVSGCTTAPKATPGKMTIAATFFPIYDLTRAIAGNAATVYSIVPLNAEPHEYESTPQDLIRLDSAQVFVTLGVKKGFAPFEANLIKAVSGNVTIVEAGKGIQQIPPSAEAGDISPAASYSGLDPHIWVSPRNAIKMAENIRDGLVKADPTHAENYTENAAALITRLEALDANYTKGLADCSKRVVLTGHDAYSYLARDYNFTAYYISGLSPTEEPTPQQIARLVDVARQYNLTYIFFDVAADPRIAQTIASQVGAKTLPLDPAASTADPSATYIGIMEKDLGYLREAMACR